jgi:hypothetical protein
MIYLWIPLLLAALGLLLLKFISFLWVPISLILFLYFIRYLNVLRQHNFYAAQGVAFSGAPYKAIVKDVSTLLNALENNPTTLAMTDILHSLHGPTLPPIVGMYFGQKPFLLITCP